MERYIELCFKYGIDKEIEIFGLTNIWILPEDGYGKVAEDFPDAIRICYFDRSDSCYKYIRYSSSIFYENFSNFQQQLYGLCFHYA